MQLDLVEGGGDAGLVHEPFELILGEVRDTDRADLAGFKNIDHSSPGLDDADFIGDDIDISFGSKVDELLELRTTERNGPLSEIVFNSL